MILTKSQKAMCMLSWIRLHSLCLVLIWTEKCKNGSKNNCLLDKGCIDNVCVTHVTLYKLHNEQNVAWGTFVCLISFLTWLGNENQWMFARTPKCNLTIELARHLRSWEALRNFLLIPFFVGAFVYLYYTLHCPWFLLVSWT